MSSPRAATGDEIRAQRHVVARAQARSPEDIEWLRTLRALTILVDLHRRTPEQQRYARFDRPQDNPQHNGVHIVAALTHLDADGSIDGWAREISDNLSNEPMLVRRLRPVLRQLNLPTEPTGRRLIATPLSPRTRKAPVTTLLRFKADEELDPRWLGRLRPAAHALREAGLTPANIPNNLLALIDRNPFAEELVPSFAPAAALCSIAFDLPLTKAGLRIGGKASTCAMAASYLAQTPAAATLDRAERAAAALAGQRPTDFAELRSQQRSMKRVNGTVLRDLQLHPPSQRAIGPGQSAAIWLWSTVAGSHPSLFPDGHGSRLRPLRTLLDQWHRATPEQNLIALIDWNVRHTLHPQRTADHRQGGAPKYPSGRRTA